MDKDTFSKHCPYNSPIYCLYSTQDCATHQHLDFYEFCIFSSGSYQNIYQNQVFPCSTSHLLFFKPGSIHELRKNYYHSEHYSIIIRQDFFIEYFRKYCERHESYSDSTLLPDSISKELSGSQASYLCKLASVIAHNISNERFVIAEHLLDMLLFACMEDIPLSSNTGIDTYINDILREFDSYHLLDEDIPDILSKLPVSQRTLLKRFKALTGCTFIEYRNKKKFEYAAQLLQRENFSIATISNMLGISCPSYFAKQFKIHFGMTPKQYQTKYQKYKSHV